MKAPRPLVVVTGVQIEQVGFLKYAWMTQDTHLKATRVPDAGNRACTFPAFPSWEVIPSNQDLVISV